MKPFARIATCAAVFAALALLSACESRLNFRRTKAPDGPSFAPVSAIRSYNMVFNPKANGVSVLHLEDGSEYTFDRLNATQLSSVLILLNNKALAFDTQNGELRLQGGVQ